jgi:predicted acylesterase/phospholipase RssA/CRP-like cAMP-binding protein
VCAVIDPASTETTQQQIETQVEAVRRMVRATLRLFLHGHPDTESTETLRTSIVDVERYASEWAWLVPADPVERAALREALDTHFRPAIPPTGPPSAVDELEQAADSIVVAGGDTLLEQGELSADFYIVLSGRLAAARVEPGGGERLIGEMVRGNSIGELAALTGEPRSARVFALRDSHLLRVPHAAFDTLVARHPEVLRGIIGTLVAREREQDRRPRRPPTRTLAIVPLGPNVPIDAFTATLAAALAEHHSTRLITSREADSTPHAVHRGWLNGLEEAYRFVLYQADSEATEWSARCVRQADRVLLVGMVGGDPTPSIVEQLLGRHFAAPRELVLVHAAGTPISNTAAWLTHRCVSRFHHVELGSTSDIRRLARHVVGRSVGLVLGGGGARAFAHVGAVRALSEAGVPIDVVGGVSAGAVVAAQLALGRSPADLYRQNQRIAQRGKALIDYTVPLVSLVEARKFTMVLRELFGDTRIEDLSLPFWCLSSNLTRAEKVVHRAGPLGPAVRASCALPGVLPPVLMDGDVLVDGGLVDTVPAATMNEFLDGSGVTIALDVSAEVDLARDYSFGMSVSGLRLLWERVNPLATRSLQAPSMAAVLLRSIELGSVMHRREHHDTTRLYLKLPVSHIDRLAFDLDSFERLVDIGYSATRAALQAEGGLADLTVVSSD